MSLHSEDKEQLRVVQAPCDDSARNAGLSLSDALGIYKAHVESTHRLWGYFQAIAFAAVASGWSQSPPPNAHRVLLAGITLAFAVFATCNGYLVGRYQHRSVDCASAIVTYTKAHPTAITAELDRVVGTLKSGRPAGVVSFYAGLSIFVCVAIWSRVIFGA
jgi:hypothetical protein